MGVTRCLYGHCLLGRPDLQANRNWIARRESLFEGLVKERVQVCDCSRRQTFLIGRHDSSPFQLTVGIHEAKPEVGSACGVR